METNKSLTTTKNNNKTALVVADNLRNSILQIKELSDTEKQIVIASVEKPLVNCVLSDLAPTLEKIYMMLGIGKSKYPSKEERDFLIAEIKIMFPSRTIQDVLVALRLVLSGEINFDINLYDRIISPAFVAGLFNAYNNYRMATKMKYERILEEQQEEANKPTPDQIKQRNYSSKKRACIQLFEEHKKTPITDISKVDNPELNRYKFLSVLCLFSYTEEEKIEFAKKAEIILKEENDKIAEKKKGKEKEIIAGTVIKDLFFTNDKEKLEAYTNNLQILHYFNDLILDGKELSDEIARAEGGKVEPANA